MLTDRTIRAARVGARPLKLSDGGGLRLLCRPSGSRTWQLRFRFDGKEQLLTFGAWPEVSIADARERRDDARAALDRGEDPREATRSSSAVARTFEQVARAWHAHRAGRWSATHAADVLDSLERLVFPVIGARPLAAIDAPAVLAVTRAIEATGAIVTAHRVRQRIAKVFASAINLELCTANPAAGIVDELEIAPPVEHHPALTDPGELRELLARVGCLRAAPVAKLCSRFLALTAVRLDSARGARWGEIEGVDWSSDTPAPDALWRVPPARLKLKKGRKVDAVNEHLVPLSGAAVMVLREARLSISATASASEKGDALIFPGRGGAAPIGEKALGDLYDRAGYAGRHCPHGWRASFSTILNELSPADELIVELMLAHAPKNKVKAAYDRAAHLPRRRFLFETWAELLGLS